jgi:hypothetical protein
MAMEINTVVFIGKSKKKTGNTRFMMKALRRRVKKAVFINLPRQKKLFFWTDYRKVVQKKIVRTRPDLVISYSKDIPFQVLKNIHSLFKTAIFYVDVFEPVEPKLIRYARLVDYLFITNKKQIEELKSSGVKKPVFCMQGCDRDAHRIIPTRSPRWASQVAFVGRPVTDYRINLLQQIAHRYDLNAWGADWQKYGLKCPKKNVYPKEFAKICYASAIIIGCDRSLQMDYNTSNRTWITLGCGGFLLTNYQIGLDEIFVKGKHLEWYCNPEECLDLIDYYLKNPDRRKKIAQNGYQYAHAHRTYDVVMDEIITCIENDADAP